MTMQIADLKKQNQQQPLENVKKERSIFELLEDPRVAKGMGAVATQFLTPDRFLRLAVNAIKKTPLLAQCDPKTVLGSFMTSAALGLEPNTVMQQAFLIPYKKRANIDGEWVDVYECNFQIGYRGFVTLAHRSPYVDSLEAEAIHKGDHFKHMKGSKSFLEYEKALMERGDLIGAFCFSKLASGAEAATVLPLDELMKIRSRSETYNALVRNVENAKAGKDREKAEQKLADTPWVLWEDDMCAKSAIKKHCKQLPLSPDDAMSTAAKLDGDDGNVIDMATMADPDVVRAVMADGGEIVESGAPSMATQMLEQNESPTLSQNIRPLREATTVEVNRDTGTNNQQTAAAQQRQAAGDHGPTVSEVRSRLQRATDIDVLDADADLIRTVPLEEQQALTDLYRERRNALANPEPTARRPQPRQMNIE